MAQDQRSQRKKPRDKLWLWITPPVYDNNQQRWQITVSATLSAGPNTSGAVLKFFADGREFARRKTDQSGSAGAECLLGVGRHEIEVVFTTTQQLVRVEIAPQVHLDLTDSSETIGNGFCVTASAYVSLAGAPVVGIPVLFFCDEEQYQEPQQTDTDGRAGMAFLNLREGRHIFSALLQGSTIRARQSLTAQQQREITLTLSDPYRDPEDAKHFRAVVVALVSEESRPAAGVAVDFFLDGAPLTLLQTDADGRAVVHVSALEPRGYLVEAGINGRNKKAAGVLRVNEETRSVPVDFLVHTMAQGGRHLVTVTVVSADGRGVSRWPVEFQGAGFGENLFYVEETDEFGVCRLIIDAPSEEQPRRIAIAPKGCRWKEEKLFPEIDPKREKQDV